VIGLTPKQAKTLAFIGAYVRENDGVSPTFAEIMEAVGIGSKGEVHRMVSALEVRGHIRRLYHRARAIEVLSPAAPGKTADDVAATITGRLWARKEAGIPITRPVLYDIVREALR